MCSSSIELGGSAERRRRKVEKGVGGRKEVVQGQRGPREDADGGERGVSAGDRLGIPGYQEGLGEHVMNGLPGDVEEV